MQTQQSVSISPNWEEKLKDFYDAQVSEQRLQVRSQGEEEARNLLKHKLGQFEQADIKKFLEALNHDWWPDRERKDRFMPAFYGALANQIADSWGAFNKWSEKIWNAPDSGIGKVLDQFWKQNEIAGAGTSLPTAFLYLRDPEKYAIWLPSFEMGLKVIGPFKLGKRRTADGYKIFNSQFHQLRELLGYIPQSMDIILSMAAKESIDEGSFEYLFQEFLTTYMDIEKGQSHLQAYYEQRRKATENYEELKKKYQRGDDITDFVLLKCLPHANTKPNRQRGAWIHVAPSITKDIKQWYENSGLVKPDQWQSVAKAIFEFFEQCFKDPARLADHCSYFQETIPTKGFQMGILTPFLNAIDPEHFAIVNNKPRLVINYFQKKSFSNNIAEYPEINRMIFDFIKAREEFFSEVTDNSALKTDVFDQFCHWMVGVKKFNFKESQVYKIAPGKNANKWDDWVSNGYVSIGWEDLGDLGGLSKSEFERRRNQVLTQHSDWTQKALNQVWQFANIKEGDRVIANKGKKEILGFGTVIGPYYFVPNTEHGHRLPVMWDDLTRRSVEEASWSGTLQKISPSRFEELKIAQSIETEPGELGTRNPIYSISQCAKDIGFNEEELECWINGIIRKKQAIIYGPPGTGKTYVANLIADHLIGGGYGFKQLIQFHPEYAYQDFMQGIRPITKDGVLRYEMVPGVFYKFCGEAGEVGDSACVLIIDEINRANLSRVFGELMYLLEYRDESVELPGGGSFKIPHNVRIIGTMNTADRSIALVDYALRRRFAFLKLEPNYHILEKYHETTGFDASLLIQILEEINTQIDNPNYELGISFFLTEDIDNQIEDIWKMEIEPYIEEYFFDDPEKVNMFRWETIKSRFQ